MTFEEKNCAEDLIAFINRATSPYHAVEQSNGALPAVPLFGAEGIHARQCYYFPLYNTGTVIISIGENPRGPLRIACAHTDFPCLRIKPNPILRMYGYGKLNAEVYGGMIRNTWMDRPLSLAGAVALCGDDAFTPKLRLVDFRPRPCPTLR